VSELEKESERTESGKRDNRITLREMEYMRESEDIRE